MNPTFSINRGRIYDVIKMVNKILKYSVIVILDLQMAWKLLNEKRIQVYFFLQLQKEIFATRNLNTNWNLSLRSLKISISLYN